MKNVRLKKYLSKSLMIGFLLVLIACSNNPESKLVQNDLKISTNKFAEGFVIEKADNYTLLTVRNPWQGAQNAEYKYQLVERGVKAESIQGAERITLPIERVVCMSTTHVALLDELGCSDKIVGVSGSQYVNTKSVKKGIESGKIKDVGYESNLNYELIASLNADLVIVYGIEGNVTSYCQRLKDLGISTILNADYLEQHPLGKSEWIKFLGSLMQKGDVAENHFEKISANYDSLSKLALDIEAKPRIMVGLPWKGTWYIPGGNSFLAQFINDAGGDYLWKDNDSRESYPIDIETIFSKAQKVDVWINTGSANSKSNIIDVDERFETFEPLKKSRIYNNNAITTKGGGNDYWESGIRRPDVILKDLIKVFHPDVLPNHEFVYYKEIK